MYRPSPFRAGNIQKLAYGGVDGDTDNAEIKPLLDSDDSDKPVSTDGVKVEVEEKSTWASKWGPCTGHNLMMAGIFLVLLTGLIIAATFRARNIKKHKKIAELLRDNVFNKDLPEYSIVRSPKMNRYRILLIVPCLAIAAIITYYTLWKTGRLGDDCSYNWLHGFVLGPILLLMSVLIIVKNLKDYKKLQKGLDSIKKRINAFETFVKNNLYRYNYNTAANRLGRRGGSTSSPEKMYKALSKGKSVDSSINRAVRAALNKDDYLTKTMADHELNLQQIMYTLSLYQFMMDDKVEKNKVKALFSLSGVYSGSFRIADHMRAYTLTNMGNMQYIDNVAIYINRYSKIRMNNASMRALKMKVAKQLHNTSARAAGIKAYKGWDNLKKLDNDYLGIYILSIIVAPFALILFVLGYVLYLQFKNWRANKKAVTMTSP